MNLYFCTIGQTRRYKAVVEFNLLGKLPVKTARSQIDVREKALDQYRLNTDYYPVLLTGSV